MAALLKSGKFLRMVTGVVRSGPSHSGPQQQSLLPLNNTNGTGNLGPTLGEKGGGLDSGGTLNFSDGGAAFQPWSLHNLQSALPVLAGASQTEDEEKKDPLLGHLLDRQKVEQFCNKTWSETQKELVELEKELEREQKAIENKNASNNRSKESTLKSNAMFTKSRKKKVSAKRKSSIHNRNKELGRPISLNVIYEEPSQLASSTQKDEIEVKSDILGTPIETAKTSDQNSILNEKTEDKQTHKKNESNTSSIKMTDFNDTCKIVKPSSIEDLTETQESLTIIHANNNNAEPEMTRQESQCVTTYGENLTFPPADENWETRLPSLDFSNPTNSNKEIPAPTTSGVYYSEIAEESNNLTDETSSEHQQSDMPVVAPADYVPMVQVFEIEPYSEAHWYPLDVVCRTFREQGRYWDLECLLDGSRGIKPEDRQTIYLWTLQAYADAGIFDRAVALSGQLHLEGLGVNFPAYHQLMSSFAAAQQSFAPTLPYSSYAYPNVSQVDSNQYIESLQTDTSSQTGMTVTPTDASLVSTPRSSCPPTPGPLSVEESNTSSNDGLRRRYQRHPRDDRELCKSVKTSRSSERKVSAAAANSVAQHLQRRFKRALSEKNLEECLFSYYQLEKLNSKRGSSDPNSNYNKTTINVTDSSSLIEFLVKDNRVNEATNVTESILASDAYPIPKIFRFLLNRLASNGEVDAMSRFDKYLTPRVKKEVSFDNRLCNAYLAAGRGSEYLDMLSEEVDDILRTGKLEEIDPSTVQSVKDKFPRGGAMGLLESDPKLVENFTDLAYKFAELGYIAPMNVLWTYHFIGGRHDIATPLWQDYVQGCPQIMFQKVCQTARSSCNADLAQRLVNVLEDASTVTMGARGIAYSCLIDVLTQQQNYIAAIDALEKGLTTGIKLEDVNRTALKRLKQGLEHTSSQTFPFEIPKKDAKNENGMLSKPENDERYESDNSIAMIN